MLAADHDIAGSSTNAANTTASWTTCSGADRTAARARCTAARPRARSPRAPREPRPAPAPRPARCARAPFPTRDGQRVSSPRCSASTRQPLAQRPDHEHVDGADFCVCHGRKLRRRRSGRATMLIEVVADSNASPSNASELGCGAAARTAMPRAGSDTTPARRPASRRAAPLRSSSGPRPRAPRPTSTASACRRPAPPRRFARSIRRRQRGARIRTSR